MISSSPRCVPVLLRVAVLFLLVMIRPAYGDEPEPEEWPDDETVAAALIFSNLATSIINFDHAAGGKGSLAMGFFGLALGGATLAIGNADDRTALSASGALSGFFGLASFVVGLAHAASKTGTVSAQPFTGEIAGEQCDIGVVASLRF